LHQCFIENILLLSLCEYSGARLNFPEMMGYIDTSNTLSRLKKRRFYVSKYILYFQDFFDYSLIPYPYSYLKSKIMYDLLLFSNSPYSLSNNTFFIKYIFIVGMFIHCISTKYCKCSDFDTTRIYIGCKETFKFYFYDKLLKIAFDYTDKYFNEIEVEYGIMLENHIDTPIKFKKKFGDIVGKFEKDVEHEMKIVNGIDDF
jgi:hypothetical protein